MPFIGVTPDCVLDDDGASAKSRVGYHDAVHFSREFKSLFGDPPLRQVQSLREQVSQSDKAPGGDAQR